MTLYLKVGWLVGACMGRWIDRSIHRSIVLTAVETDKSPQKDGSCNTVLAMDARHVLTHTLMSFWSQ